MPITREQATIIHDEVIETVEQLIECLTKNKTPAMIGELAMVWLAGRSAGSAMRPLTDILIPTLEVGWQQAVESGR